MKDCIVDHDNNTIIYLVNPGEAGIAIGKNGINIKKTRKILGKNIEVVEYSDDFTQLVKNIFLPARVHSVKKVNHPNKRVVVYVNVHPQDKGLAIGRNGRNVQKAKLILKRYYDVDNVVVV